MTMVDVEGLRALFGAISQKLTAARDHLCELDGVIGDADHGVTMELGFSTVKKALDEIDPDTTNLGQVFNLAAKSFLNAVGASSGPLYATAFMRAGAALKDKSIADDAELVAAFVAMAKGIEDRGKAVIGEKTMVDAWRPAADAAEACRLSGGDLAACLKAATEAAKAGAEATKSMLATKGRAARLGERVIGHMDPGAASAALIIETMAKSLA